MSFNFNQHSIIEVLQLWFIRLISLFVSFIFSLVFIIITISVIFAFKPNTAYISYDAKDVSALSAIEANALYGTLGVKEFALSDFEELIFYPYFDINYNINGTTYAGDDISSFKIVPFAFNSYRDVYGNLIEQKTMMLFHVDSVSMNYLYISSIPKESSIENETAVSIDEFSNTMSIHFKYGFSGFFKNSDNQGAYNHDGEFYVPETDEFELPPQPCQSAHFQNCKLILNLIDGTEIDCGEIISSKEINIDVNTFYIPHEVTLETIPAVDGYWDYSVIDMSVVGVKKIQSEGSGLLSFFYTSSPIEYNLINQKLVLYNKDNNLGMKIGFMDNSKETESNNFYINGTVKKSAILSENNLFPNIFSWFRENALLAPLTLVSVVFSTFSLNQRKKEKSDE